MNMPYIWWLHVAGASWHFRHQSVDAAQLGWTQRQILDDFIVGITDLIEFIEIWSIVELIKVIIRSAGQLMGRLQSLLPQRQASRAPDDPTEPEQGERDVGPKIVPT